MHSPSDTSDPATSLHNHDAPPFRINLALGAMGALSSGATTGSSDSSGSGTDIDGCHNNAFSPAVSKI